MQKDLGSQPSRLSFHQGKALLFLANIYSRLHDVVLELVQNALDANGSRITISINYRTLRLTVRDNGEGVSLDRFNAALATIATPNRKLEGSLGQFGIGLISPLGKCESFTFTSCPAPHLYGFQTWEFVTDVITNKTNDLIVPLKARPELTLDTEKNTMSRFKTVVPWRTEVSLINITTDRLIGCVEMESLVSAIQERFATTMRRNKTIVSISIMKADGTKEERLNVQAPAFRGLALGEVEILSPEAGKVIFNLYVARKTTQGRGGKVLMGVLGNDFRFPFHLFSRTAQHLLKEEVVTALSSGVFEGEIVAEKATLHASRNAFNKDDAFIGLCVAIEAWFEKHGANHLRSVKQSRREERYQELGLRSLGVLENLLKNPANASLLKVVQSFSRGTIGQGHAEPKKSLGEQGHTALSIDGKPGSSRDRNSGAEPRERSDPQKEKVSHMPMTVAGPKGQVRKVVRSSSVGLQLSHDPDKASEMSSLWELDEVHGILYLNIRHPLWVACEDKDVPLMRLQECIAMQALTLHGMPDQYRFHQRQAMDELNHSLVHWLLEGDKARSSAKRKESRPGSKKKGADKK